MKAQLRLTYSEDEFFSLYEKKYNNKLKGLRPDHALFIGMTISDEVCGEIIKQASRKYKLTKKQSESCVLFYQEKQKEVRAVFNL